MNSPLPQFTAAKIAEAIGKAPRLVRRALAGTAPTGECVVRGNLTSQWTFAALPLGLQRELEAAAQNRGLNTVAALFQEVPPWQPEIVWREVCPEQQTEALKLQRALLPTLERQHSPILEGSELVAIGLRDYEREFSRTISAERWRYLFNRTLQRDQGAGQFHRAEIFLPGNLKRASKSSATSHDAGEFEPLAACIARFGDPLKPTGAEIDALWIDAVELFAEQAANTNAKKLKRRLLDYLWHHAPFLAASWNALRTNFDRKVKAAAAHDGDTLALLDGRELKRGEARAAIIPQNDVDLIAWHSAKNCGGRTAQAVRELAGQGERSGLTPETLALVTAPKKSKSHVNRRLFSVVHREAELIAPYLLGKKAIDDATPSLRRDRDKLRSMHVLTADDFTMPVYCFVPDGKGWWQLTRGQVLLMIDCRSLKIIGWSLQPERNYNSLVIRTLMNRTCAQWGLPHTWLFENGIWKNARLVKGAPREWSEGKSWAALKPGWEKLGVKFNHAKRARAKPAELVGGLLQNLMERMPGYCGRDERRDCPEVTKRNKLAVEARRVEPHGLFLSFDAWDAELRKLIETYNAATQDGDILKGMSPDQAFESFWPHDDPPQKLDSTCWHLLAHYVSERVVGVEGIKFKIGGQDYIYRDENTSALRGKTVLAWFDPECPELLGVTDLKERNPVLVRRENPVDFMAAMDPSGTANRTYQLELEKVAAHNAYPKARFNVLKAKFAPSFRKNLVSPGVFNVAATFTAQRHDNETRQQTEQRQRTKIASNARKLGLPSTLVRQVDNQTAEGLEMMARAEAAMLETDDQPPAPAVKPSGKKDYFLKPFQPKGKSK